VDVRKPVASRNRATPAALLIAFVVSVCWSGATLARTQPESESGVETSLDGIAGPVSLVVKTVDHVPVEQEVSDLEDINIERATGDTGTPLFNLTPRFNETLREVFGRDEADQEGDSQATDVATSPLAEYEDIKGPSELADDVAPVDSNTEEDDLPLLRRQMYRIDI